MEKLCDYNLEKRFFKSKGGTLFMNAEKIKTATYKIVSDRGGRIVQFYCDASGMLLCTTNRINAATEEEALRIAWEAEGKKHFNLCHKCGRWVSAVMYNADVLECVDCSPWENAPKYCKTCGTKVSSDDVYCPKCGTVLKYGR